MASRESFSGRGKKSKGGKTVPHFPVKQIHKLLLKGKKNADPRAAVYLTAALEYVAAEILELSGNIAKEKDGKHDIDDHYVHIAVENDEKLAKLLQKCKDK